MEWSAKYVTNKEMTFLRFSKTEIGFGGIKNFNNVSVAVPRGRGRGAKGGHGPCPCKHKSYKRWMPNTAAYISCFLAPQPDTGSVTDAFSTRYSGLSILLLMHK